MAQLRYIYLRDTKQQPCACIAVVYNKKASTVSYALSVLNPRDRFNRKVARDLAVGRLVQKGVSIDLSQVKSINCHVISRQILSDLITWEDLPSRARKSAKRWLSENDEIEAGSEQASNVVNLFGGHSK